MNLKILFLQYYLAAINNYENRFKDLSDRLKRNSINDEDMIEYIKLQGELKAFKQTYEDLNRFVELAENDKSSYTK